MCGTGPLLEEPLAEGKEMAPNPIVYAAFNTMRAISSVDNAIENFILELDHVQPVCMIPTLNCK